MNHDTVERTRTAVIYVLIKILQLATKSIWSGIIKIESPNTQKSDIINSERAASLQNKLC